ncbi:MAG: AraC family transcriptional regulator ligand-binding domain-containing protein [Pseudomonadota bacterium]|nr:AraC family transcriptional regulator ligand-binding domain-containing protein [Pseudomonadota bacterium]MEE3320892.1 AraC family transcriptional regulator ligand-binding domain-containing protein [Pseudomonadota bacterium]
MDPMAPERLKPGIHPAYSRLLCAWLQGQGFSRADIFSGTRLQWSELVNEHRYLSLEQLSRLIRRARALTGVEGQGLELGRSTSVSAHGALGYAVVSSANLGDMLSVLERFVSIRIRWVSLYLRREPGVAHLDIKETVDLGDCREFIHGALLGTFVQMVQAVTPNQCQRLSVALPFSSPAIQARYSALMDCQLCFAAPAFTISLPEVLLATPCLTADVATHRNAIRDCEHQRATLQRGGPLSQQISIALLDQGGQFPSLEVMAERFAMSSRSLIRKLKSEDTSYQQLLDEVRKEQALWLLQETSLPIERIAEQLGYQDTSNFSRTFRRWFGQTPLAMRKGASPEP